MNKLWKIVSFLLLMLAVSYAQEDGATEQMKVDEAFEKAQEQVAQEAAAAAETVAAAVDEVVEAVEDVVDAVPETIVEDVVESISRGGAADDKSKTSPLSSIKTKLSGLVDSVVTKSKDVVATVKKQDMKKVAVGAIGVWGVAVGVGYLTKQD